MSSERVGLMSAMICARQVYVFETFLCLFFPFEIFIPQFRADSCQFSLLKHRKEIPANIQGFTDRTIFLFSLAHKLVFKFLCKLQQFLVSYAQCVFSNNSNKTSKIHSFCIVCVHLV